MTIFSLCSVRGEDTSNQAPISSQAPVSGWRFTVDQILVYTYECTQNVEWDSAGDKLQYSTTMGWRFIVVPKIVTAESVELKVTILSVRAHHEGPGSSSTIDSRAPTGEQGDDSPLLGHLLALSNAVLVVTCDPRTGQVSSVRGGEEIAKRIAKRSPSSFGSEASPLQVPAEKAYSSERLTPLWSRLLMVPASGKRLVALGDPLTAQVEEQWKDATWTWALPTGAEPTAVSLATDPSPITATLTALSGKGAITSSAIPTDTAGEMSWTLTFQALTQPVEQRHHLQWQLHLEGGAPPRAK